MLEKTVNPDVQDIAQDSEGSSDHVYIDPVLEKRVVKKLDMFIVPVFMICYLFSFLDRSNLGNAKIQGLETDLGLKDNEFNGTFLCVI